VEKVTTEGKLCRTLYVYDYKTKYWTAEKGLKKLMCDCLRQFYTHMDMDFARTIQECSDEQANKVAQEKKQIILKILARINSHCSSINVRARRVERRVALLVCGV
jgi:hypothetical protein